MIRAAASAVCASALVVASLMLTATPAAADTSGDYSYRDNGDGTATVTGYTGASGDIAIPSELGGLRVSGIGDQAFQRDNLTSATIPDSVTTIGASAFRINKLTSVTIPDSVTTIGESAFQSNELASVVLSDALTTIGVSAFLGNRLVSVTIPDSVTTIGQTAFQGNQLTSLTIPDSVTTVDARAFCFNELTSVTVHGATSFGKGVFTGNPGLIGTLTFLAGPPPNITDRAAANALVDNTDSVTLRYYADSGFSDEVWGSYATQPLGPTSLSVVATPTSVAAGGSVRIAVTGTDEFGHEFGDVTDQVSLSSSVATDVIDAGANGGPTVTFPHASTHVITAALTADPTVTGSVRVTVEPAVTPAAGVHPDQSRAELAASGRDLPSPVWPLGAVALTLVGACLVLFRRRAAA